MPHSVYMPKVESGVLHNAKRSRWVTGECVDKGLLDSNGSISVTNDWKLDGDLVFTVGNHVLQPLVVTLHLQCST